MNGLAEYWRTRGKLTIFERTRILSIRAVMISNGKAPFDDACSKPYIIETAEEEMRRGFLGALVPCRDAHLHGHGPSDPSISNPLTHPFDGNPKH